MITTPVQPDLTLLEYIVELGLTHVARHNGESDVQLRERLDGILEEQIARLPFVFACDRLGCFPAQQPCSCFTCRYNWYVEQGIDPGPIEVDMWGDSDSEEWNA